MDNGIPGGQHARITYIFYLDETEHAVFNDGRVTAGSLLEAMIRMPDKLLETAINELQVDPRRIQPVQMSTEPYVENGQTRALVGVAVVLVHPLISVPQMQTPGGIILGGR